MVDNGVERYGYGAGNRRLWRSTGTATVTVYLYGLGGELLEVFLGSVGSPLERQVYTRTQRAWFGGRLLEKKGTAMNADRLGSYQGTYPYGELQGTVGTPGEKFGTYWRDATGLDYVVNRYYSSQMGRFLSADPYVASGGLANPGSWNRYAYTQGDPINTNDPVGLQAAPLEPPPTAGGGNSFLAFLDRYFFTVQMQKQAVGALAKMSVNCRTVLSSTTLPVLPPGAVGPTWSVLDAITAAASNVYFYDYYGPESELTFRSATGIPIADRTITIHTVASEFLDNGSISVTLSIDNQNIRHIVIEPYLFFTSTDSWQSASLIHELLHVVIGDHGAIYELLSIPTEYEKNPTSDLSRWIEEGCKR